MFAAYKKNQLNLNIKIESIVERLVNELPGLIAIYLHGSAVKNGLRPDSDLDLALLFEHDKVPDAKTIFIVKPEIEEVACKVVDLGILTTENPVFAKEVIISGKRLFCDDIFACEQFEMYIFSFYGKLNDERKQILDSYQTDSSAQINQGSL